MMEPTRGTTPLTCTHSLLQPRRTTMALLLCSRLLASRSCVAAWRRGPLSPVASVGAQHGAKPATRDSAAGHGAWHANAVPPLLGGARLFGSPDASTDGESVVTAASIRQLSALATPVKASAEVSATGHGAAERQVHIALAHSKDLVCMNLMCEKVGTPCLCKLSLVLGRLAEPGAPPMTVAEVDLSSNGLEQVPEPLLTPPLASQLVRLDLRDNRLASFSVDHLPGLSALKHLDLRGNPLPPHDCARLVDAVGELQARGREVTLLLDQ